MIAWVHHHAVACSEFRIKSEPLKASGGTSSKSLSSKSPHFGVWLVGVSVPFSSPCRGNVLAGCSSLQKSMAFEAVLP